MGAGTDDELPVGAEEVVLDVAEVPAGRLEVDMRLIGVMICGVVDEWTKMRERRANGDERRGEEGMRRRFSNRVLLTLCVRTCALLA